MSKKHITTALLKQRLLIIYSLWCLFLLGTVHASMPLLKFDFLFNQSLTSKPFDQEYFREDNWKVSFYMALPTNKVLEATFNYVSPFIKCQTQYITLFQEMIMVFTKTQCSTPRLGLQIWSISVISVKDILHTGCSLWMCIRPH